MSGVRPEDLSEGELVEQNKLLRKKNKNLRHSLRRMKKNQAEGVRYSDLSMMVEPDGSTVTLRFKRNNLIVKSIEHKDKVTLLVLEQSGTPITQSHDRPSAFDNLKEQYESPVESWVPNSS